VEQSQAASAKAAVAYRSLFLISPYSHICQDPAR
jgi:hypothetical protein